MAHLGEAFQAARRLSINRIEQSAVADSDFLTMTDNRDSAASSTAGRILKAANEVYNKHPVLPLPLATVAERADVSRTLIYARYGDQYALVNSLIESHLAHIQTDLMALLDRKAPFREIILALAERLFDHFVDHGLLLTNAMRDDFLQDHLSPLLQSAMRIGLKRLATQAHAEFAFNRREALAAVLMLAVIPEQAARLVRVGQVSRDVGLWSVERGINVSVDTFSS